MYELYDICAEILEYFSGMIDVILDVLFFEVPLLNVSVMHIIFGPGIVIYVAFVLTKFFVKIF